jgi:hypothetical protein
VSDLDQVVSKDRIRRFLEQTGKGQAVADLQDLMTALVGGGHAPGMNS